MIPRSLHVLEDAILLPLREYDRSTSAVRLGECYTEALGIVEKEFPE